MKIEECLHTQIKELMLENQDIELERQETKAKLITLFAVLNKAQELAQELESILKDELILDIDYFEETLAEYPDDLKVSDYLYPLSTLVKQTINAFDNEQTTLF